MKKFTIITLLALFISINPICAQIIKGHVYDAETNEPLIGATIQCKQKGANGTVTDINGAYELKVPNGGSDLLYSYVGYEDEMVPIVVDLRETITKDIYMRSASKLLDDVVVSAGRFEQKLSDVTVSMDLIKADGISLQAPTDISSTLKTLPGVDIVDKQPSIRGGGGWTYSVGSRSQILVDGMSILNPKTGEINWNAVAVENIDQVEVMKGASSVLYGSSALNGVINIRTARPGLTPVTHASIFCGIYDDLNSKYQWSDKSFWKDGKYAVKPLLRSTILSGVRNPLYEGLDFSHTRRIGDFDVSGGLNLFTDEGYREQGYNKRFRAGGNLTYNQPNRDKYLINYGFNIDYLSNQSGDFFIWRSAEEALRPSPFTNMGREVNDFHIDPFFNFTNRDKGYSHRIKTRFHYINDNIVNPTSTAEIADILGDMGTDVNALTGMVNNISSGDYSQLYPIVQPLLQGDWGGVLSAANNILKPIFPNATTSNYCDLIAWTMKHGLPSGTSDIVPWLSGIINPNKNAGSTVGGVDKSYTYFFDYQFNKKWNNGIQITTGATFEHNSVSAETTGTHNSDNIAGFFQYDQRFFDRLSISAGLRAEYYRVDEFYREADTKVFNTTIPIRPVFRAGINYQAADYTFIRASFGQGYRYPSLAEKYARKDIGGVGVYPNLDLKAEKGINVELGVKQGYQAGPLKGFVDAAAFYTQYDNMIEFQFGLFDNYTYKPINNISDAVAMFTNGSGFGIGAQFHNVSRARIYGAEISTNGVYDINNTMKLSYNIGYVYIEPRDTDYKERNELEATYSDPLQMKEKSNDSKYLKYRQKHTFKTTLDYQWQRLSLGANMMYKSKTLAVDYLMLDEREKVQLDMMDAIRQILFGNVNGNTLASYWEEHNKGYFTMDLRFGVKVTKEVDFQFMINNVLNTEYSTRPMAIETPRTYVFKLNLTL